MTQFEHAVKKQEEIENLKKELKQLKEKQKTVVNDIYMIPIDLVHNDFGENTNGFLPSDWNELNELPKEVLTYVKICKEMDLVYNPYNFMLDFNLSQDTTNPEDYLMFIPDPKFNL